MAYSATANLNAIFGSDNVSEWADLNNNAVAGEIAAAIAAAIAKADEEIDDYLRDTHYNLPLKDVGGSVPTGVTDIAATLAGIKLHDWRGIVEGDNLESHRAFVKTALDDVRSGRRKLNAI